MKSSTNSIIVFSLLLTANYTQLAAQTTTGYSDLSIILKADTTCRSVLVSNLFEDRAGDKSPVIGTAAWFDKGKQLTCRSYLAFNYGALPRLVKPEQVTYAELILNPVQLEGAVDNNENSIFIIRRVLQPWEDSLTTWVSQPLSNSGEELIKQVSQKKKDRSVKVDVTKMVRDMFRFGNNGFLICNRDSLEQQVTFSQWFASAKNENKDIRPVLVIHYLAPYHYSQSRVKDIPPLPLTAKDRQEYMEMYFRPEPVTTAPVKEPVKE